MSAKNCRFFSFLLYHNLRTIYSNEIKSLSLLQNHNNIHTTFGKGWLASWIFHIICTRIMSITKAAECKVGSKTHSTALKLARGSRRMLPKNFKICPHEVESESSFDGAVKFMVGGYPPHPLWPGYHSYCKSLIVKYLVTS